MPGRPRWLLRQIVFVMLLIKLNTPMAEILERFDLAFGRVGHGHTKSSIEYAQEKYLSHGGYDLDLFWGDGNPAAPQGKLGYLMGLRALDYSYAEIASRIQPRWTMNWAQLSYLKKKEEPIEVAATKAVEIAVITNHEYAKYAGKTSLMYTYPRADDFVPQWVITCHQNFVSPENIYAFQLETEMLDKYGNWLSLVPLQNAIDFDHIIFILTRFVDGFADRYRLLDPVPVAQMMPTQYGNGAGLYN